MQRTTLLSVVLSHSGQSPVPQDQTVHSRVISHPRLGISGLPLLHVYRWSHPSPHVIEMVIGLTGSRAMGYIKARASAECACVSVASFPGLREREEK